MKKPLGMSKGGKNKKPTRQLGGTNNFVLMSENGSQQEPKRSGSNIRGWLEGSVQKLGTSDSYSNFFESSIFSTEQKDPNKKRFKRNKDGKPFALSVRCNTEENIEPPRPFCYQMSESDRMSKISGSTSEAIFMSHDNSMMSSIASVNNFNEKDLCKDETEKIEFINKYNEAKKKEKRYRKEVKILKMEKKQLQLKTEDVDKHLQIEAEKVIERTLVKLQEKQEAHGKSKINRTLCKFLISPL